MTGLGARHEMINCELGLEAEHASGVPGRKSSGRAASRCAPSRWERVATKEPGCASKNMASSRYGT